MGAFDDLIPGSQDNGFDDLVPQKKADPKIGQPEELTFAEKLVSGVKLPSWLEHIRGTAPARVIQGLADPAIGAMQTIANTLPDSTGIPQAVNKRIADLGADYKSERALAGSDGADIARTVGNVLSPVNAGLAKVLPTGATSVMGRAGEGSLAGGVGGILAPVEDASKSFWQQKAGQVGLGTLTGGVLTPALGVVGDIAVRKLGVGGPVRASSHDIDGAVADALKDTGQSIQDLSQDQLDALRGHVSTALQKGQTLDAAAALRKADFDALNMQNGPTLGQITRDPSQWAREMNLRGVDGVGEPLQGRFTGQMAELPSKLPQGGGKPAYQAGTQLSESLSNIDDTLRNHVSGLYKEARASAGKDLDVPLQGFAQDYADILHRYGDKVPSGVRNVLGDYGLGGDTQTKVFNFEEADKALKAINANRSNDPATNSALTELRTALRGAVEGVDTSGGPFRPAVNAAAERFKLHDAIPALKAAAEGSTAPDDFVKRFVLNGKTNEVKGLAQVLRTADPASFQEARAQLADQIRRAAFGETGGLTKDAPFAPARYMQTLRQIGPDKLGAFFNPEEVRDIMTVGRVGTWASVAPAKAPVSSSNSNVGVVNVLTKLPVLRQGAAVLNNVVRPIQNRADVSSALSAQVPTADAPLSDGQRNFLAYLLSLGAGGGTAAAR